MSISLIRLLIYIGFSARIMGSSTILWHRTSNKNHRAYDPWWFSWWFSPRMGISWPCGPSTHSIPSIPLVWHTALSEHRIYQTLLPNKLPQISWYGPGWPRTAGQPCSTCSPFVFRTARCVVRWQGELEHVLESETCAKNGDVKQRQWDGMGYTANMIWIAQKWGMGPTFIAIWMAENTYNTNLGYQIFRQPLWRISRFWNFPSSKRYTHIRSYPDIIQKCGLPIEYVVHECPLSRSLRIDWFAIAVS